MQILYDLVTVFREYPFNYVTEFSGRLKDVIIYKPGNLPIIIVRIISRSRVIDCAEDAAQGAGLILVTSFTVMILSAQVGKFFYYEKF